VSGYAKEALPFFFLLYFTSFCSIVRTAEYLYYLKFIGTTISRNFCTVLAHTYYTAEVLPQQMQMIVIVNMYSEKFRGRSLKSRILWSSAGSVVGVAILLNTVQFFIGARSPSFHCLPFNINYSLNDLYHHLGYAILFANVGMTAHLVFGKPGSPGVPNLCEKTRRSMHQSLFVHSSCSLGAMLPHAVYAHAYEYPFFLLSFTVNLYEYFHTLSAGILASVFIIVMPFLRSSIVESISQLSERCLRALRR
ncbi:hypothetical protein PENTCL1PPCAC_30001, partial [Pristionchus entomophagus]